VDRTKYGGWIGVSILLAGRRAAFGDTAPWGFSPLGAGNRTKNGLGYRCFWPAGARPLGVLPLRDLVPWGLRIVRGMDWGIDIFSQGAAPLGLGIERRMD
jgi:hypothetical protein